MEAYSKEPLPTTTCRNKALSATGQQKKPSPNFCFQLAFKLNVNKQYGTEIPGQHSEMLELAAF